MRVRFPSICYRLTQTIFYHPLSIWHATDFVTFIIDIILINVVCRFYLSSNMREIMSSTEKRIEKYLLKKEATA